MCQSRVQCLKVMAENCALIANPLTMYTQAEASKDVLDLSKNLVGGDFERQYGGMEKRRKRRNCMLVGLSLGALAVWLLVLTIVREVQIVRLQNEVESLKANTIAIYANVMSLNEKILNNRLFNEFKTLEDTIYADVDQEGNLVDDVKDVPKDQQGDDSLEKLHGITVLEDDSQPEDDEDMYDGDEDAESGDWYPDYDRRSEKIGTTNMIRLKPEDFTDSYLKKELTSNLREIKRLLNENPEIENIALPTEKPSPEADNSSRNKRSLFPVTSPDANSELQAPKVMSKMGDSIRRKTKKYMSETQTGKMALHTVSRTARNSNDEDGSYRRPFIAAHFHGNTSHLSTEIHEHYKGNGLVRVAHGMAHDVWYPSPWTLASPHQRPTLTRNGHVHVHHTGVYLVYVQIYYLDSHDIISWVLHRTNADIEGRETLLQCAQSTHSTERIDKPNSCFSAAALFLKAGDRLAVRNTGGDRHSLMEPEKSFIGLVKLADAEDPNEEM